MTSPKVQITQVEMLKFLEDMQNFHRACLGVKMRVKQHGYIYKRLEDIVMRLDETAEMITGIRRFLYVAREGTKVPNLHERSTF
jgi:hypothetical protein